MNSKTITEIKKKSRYVYLKLQSDNHEYKFHPEIYAMFQLYPDNSFSEEEWREIIDANNEKLALQTALGLISRREHSQGELRLKLRQRKYPKTTIDKVISTCFQLQLIDDKRFAEIYIDELKNKGLGINLIRTRLLKKQVSIDIINSLLDDRPDSDEQFKQAEKILKRKLPSLKREKDPIKRKQKAFRFLCYRGYPVEIAQQLIEKTGLSEP